MQEDEKADQLEDYFEAITKLISTYILCFETNFLNFLNNKENEDKFMEIFTCILKLMEVTYTS